MKKANKILFVLIPLIVALIVWKVNEDEREYRRKLAEARDTSVELSDLFDDDITVTIGEIEWVEKGKIFKAPVYIENLENEASHALLAYKLYGPEGNELDNLHPWYDDALSLATIIEPKSKVTSYLYFPFEGNGDYTLETRNRYKMREISITVTDDYGLTDPSTVLAASSSSVIDEPTKSSSFANSTPEPSGEIEASRPISKSSSDDIDVPPDFLTIFIQTAMEENLGEGHVNVEFDDKTDSFVISVWSDGIATGALLANAGNATTSDAWETVKTSMISLTKTIKESIEDA